MRSKSTQAKNPRDVKLIQGKRIHYKINHPLAGPNEHFDSWMSVCDRILELAEEEARECVYPEFKELVLIISDEIMDTVEEYEPEEVN